MGIRHGLGGGKYKVVIAYRYGLPKVPLEKGDSAKG